MEAVEDWKSKLHQIINEHPLSDQFQTDKTGFVYPHMSRKSFILYEMSAERLCILFLVGPLVKSHC
jgi:hypothetical protein